MKKQIAFIIWLVLSLASFGISAGGYFVNDAWIVGGPRSSAEYFIPLNETIVPTNNADSDNDGSGDLGTGTFTNADATNRTFFNWRNRGFLEAAAVNTPRYQKITGDKHASLYVEPGSTNSCLHSRKFLTWGNDGCDIAETQVGIDGAANSATLLTDDQAGNDEYVGQTIVIPDDSNTHCISVPIAKDAVTTRFPSVWTHITTGGTGQVSRINLNTVTGAIHEGDDTGANDTCGVIDMADYGLAGWWRVWLTNTNVGDGNTDLQIRFYPAGATTFTGAVGNTAVGSITADCFQVELNQSFPTNPIITTTTAVSRTTEAGFPTWDLPADVFAESLGAELMPNAVDQDFSAASAWTNVDINAYAEADDLTITAIAANQYCTLAAASAPMTATLVYKITFDLNNVVSTWKLTDFDGGQTLVSSVAANGSLVYYVTYSGATTGGFRIVSNTTTSSGDFDNFSVKQVLNPSSEGGPPRGTVVVWLRPGVGYADAPAGRLLTIGSEGRLFYTNEANNSIKSYDEANAPTVAVNYAMNTWIKGVLQFGELSSNVCKMRIGVDNGSGIGWGSETNYLGHFLDSGATTINVNTVAGYPIHIRSVAIYPDEILSDSVLDAGGSP